jgi:leader peptidase (prepilin peptidase) / N-methyltransferase
MTGPAWLVAAGVGGAVTGLALLVPTRTLLRRHDADPPWYSATVAFAAVAVTAALAAVTAWRAQDAAVLAATLCLAALAAPLATVDLAVARLPDLLVLPGYTATAASLTATSVHSGGWPDLGRAVLASAALGGVCLLVAVLADGQMGLGDVKLAALIGLAASARSWTAVLAAGFAAFALAAVTGLILVLARRASMRTRQPFGPYLLAGGLLALLA